MTPTTPSEADYDIISPFSLTALQTGNDGDVLESSLSSHVQDSGDYDDDDDASSFVIVGTPEDNGNTDACVQPKVDAPVLPAEGSPLHPIWLNPGSSSNSSSSNSRFTENPYAWRDFAGFARPMKNRLPRRENSPSRLLPPCPSLEAPPLKVSVPASGFTSCIPVWSGLGRPTIAPGESASNSGGRSSPIETEAGDQLLHHPQALRGSRAHDFVSESQAADQAFLKCIGRPRKVASSDHFLGKGKQAVRATDKGRGSVLGDAMRLAMRFPPGHPVGRSPNHSPRTSGAFPNSRPRPSAAEPPVSHPPLNGNRCYRGVPVPKKQMQNHPSPGPHQDLFGPAKTTMADEKSLMLGSAHAYMYSDARGSPAQNQSQLQQHPSTNFPSQLLSHTSVMSLTELKRSLFDSVAAPRLNPVVGGGGGGGPPALDQNRAPKASFAAYWPPPPYSSSASGDGEEADDECAEAVVRRSSTSAVWGSP